MPWCPKCGTEYRDGFETCADCGEGLVTGKRETIIAPPPKPIHPALTVMLSALTAVCAVMAAFVVAMLLWPGRWPNAASVVLLVAASLAGLFVGSNYRGRLRTLWVAVGWLLPVFPFMIGVFLPESCDSRTTTDRILDGIPSFLLLASFSSAGVAGSMLGNKPSWQRITLFCVALAALAGYFVFMLDMIDRRGHRVYR